MSRHDHATKDVPTRDFAVKADSSGEFVFEGYGAIFGKEGRDGDVIEPGAFRGTIRRRGGQFPLVRDNELTMRGRLGIARAETDRQGVKVTGYVNTKTQAGQEAKSDILHAERHGLPIGLSFGYEVIDSTRKGGTRHLKELSVYEWSVTQRPTEPGARVTDTAKCGGVARQIKRLTRRIQRHAHSTP